MFNLDGADKSFISTEHENYIDYVLYMLGGIHTSSRVAKGGFNIHTNSGLTLNVRKKPELFPRIQYPTNKVDILFLIHGKKMWFIDLQNCKRTKTYWVVDKKKNMISIEKLDDILTLLRKQHPGKIKEGTVNDTTDGYLQEQPTTVVPKEDLKETAPKQVVPNSSGISISDVTDLLTKMLSQNREIMVTITLGKELV